MHVGRSLAICLAKVDIKKKDFAGDIGVDPSNVSLMLKSDGAISARIKMLAEYFGLSASEFIKLGED